MTDNSLNLSQVIRKRLQDADKRYWAGDNISDYVSEKDKEQLINEATKAFEKVLDTLLIDRTYDPNSHGTARRLAKMYYNEKNITYFSSFVFSFCRLICSDIEWRF